MIQRLLNLSKHKEKENSFHIYIRAYPDSQHAMDCIERIKKLFEGNENEVVGHYHCQGAIDPKLIEMMKNKFGPDHPHGPNPERIKDGKMQVSIQMKMI